MTCKCSDIAPPHLNVSAVCLGHWWVFEGLGSDDLTALTESALRRNYAPHQVIFSQGDPAAAMFLIKAGRVKLSKVTESGEEITLDIRKAGDFLGETAINEDTEYPVRALCLEETLICGFTKASFEELVLKHPGIGLKVIQNLTRRIEWLTSRLGDMTHTNLETRLFRVLTNVAKEHGVKAERGFKIQFPLTHEELSFLVGAHRVSITRAMKTLRESGKLAQEGKSLIIFDEASI